MRRKLKPLIILCSLLLVLASCGKEKSVDTIGQTPGGTNGGGNGGGSGNGDGSGSGGGSSNGSEIGTWKFISLNAKTSSTVEMSMGADNMKSITTSDYTTQNNAGTCKFDGSTMTNTGMEYTLNAIGKATTYVNGVMLNTMDVPFDYTMPPTNSTATYKKIGTDSIYIESGVFTAPDGQSQQSSSGGYKLKWDGDKMMLTGNYVGTRTEVVNGMNAKIIQSAITVITLQKQ